MARERKFSKEDLYKITKETLLQHGYEGFTFSIIADYLNISRGTLYKYYDKKEELITEYMIFEMELFLKELQKIDNFETFNSQFDYLLELILNDREIHQIRGIAFHIPPTTNKKINANLEQLKILHQDMYTYLDNFVQFGKNNKIIKKHLPSSLILGVIFQTVDIPNHQGISEAEWISSIKEIISNGMFVVNS